MYLAALGNYSDRFDCCEIKVSAAVQSRSLLCWDLVWLWLVVCYQLSLDCLTLDDGTDKLPRKVCDELQTNAVHHPRRAKTPLNVSTVVLPCPRVIRSKTYRGYVKPRIIQNVTYNVIFVYQT
jgi:hypothetical protein